MSDEPELDAELVWELMVPATEIGAAEQRTKTIETQTYCYDEGFVGTDLPCRFTTTVPPEAEPSGPIYGVIIVGGLALSIAAGAGGRPMCR